MVDAHTLQVLRSVETPDTKQLYGAPWFLFHRVDLHQQLHELATTPRPSTKAVAKLNLASEVADIDLNGTMTIGSGECVKKDLIVVADGVRVGTAAHRLHLHATKIIITLLFADRTFQSEFAAKVVDPGLPIGVRPTGTAVYRFLIPTEKLLADPQTRSLFDKEGFRGSIARLQDARLVWYPCRRYDRLF